MEKNSIVLGGGCFWGVEELIRKLDFVTNTTAGYAGSDYPNPTYADVKTGMTGHAEVVEVEYLDNENNLKELLDYFFKLHDPTTLNSQGNDIGSQYRSIILFRDTFQEEIAKKAIKDASQSGIWNKPIVTELKKLTQFYQAEEYHQDYLQKFPTGYNCHYLRN